MPLAIVLVAYLSLGLNPPRALVASRVARRTGLATGLAFGAGYLLVSMVSYPGGWYFKFLAPLPMFFGCAAIAAWADRSWRSGLYAAAWAGLVAALAAFIAPLVTTLGGIQQTASMRHDFDGAAPYDTALWLPSVLGQYLSVGTIGLFAFPLLALLIGLVGAGAGAVTSRIRTA